MSRLREIRHQKGWTQHELSRRSNVPSYYISKFELGAVQPWPKARKQIAKALGMTEGEVFPTPTPEQESQILEP